MRIYTKKIVVKYYTTTTGKAAERYSDDDGVSLATTPNSGAAASEVAYYYYTIPSDLCSNSEVIGNIAHFWWGEYLSCATGQNSVVLQKVVGSLVPVACQSTVQRL